MKFGFSLGGVPPRLYLTIARRSDELGFESLWVPEHLVFPAEIRSPHPYAGEGAPPFDPNTPVLDPFALLSHLAAVTTSINLGTAVYVLPLRNLFVTARAAITVDMLSGGRFLFGVGIGWLEEEFAAVGEDWKNRAGRSLEIEHQGESYSFPGVKFRPKPKRPGGIPIIFGGTTPSALRRAAHVADGWIGVRHSPEETAAIVEKLTTLRRQHGREDEPFEITVGSDLPLSEDVVQRYAAAGAHRLSVTPWPRPQGGRLTEEHILKGMKRFADEFLVG